MSFEVISQYKKHEIINNNTIDNRKGNYTYDLDKSAYTNGTYYIFYDSSNGWLWETSFNPYYIRSANWDLGTAEEFASFVGFETENITSPFVINSETWIELNENIGDGQVVYTITTSYNTSDIEYGITGVDASNFSVNSSNGKVTLINNPNYEDKRYYYLEINAIKGSEIDNEYIYFDIKNVDEKPVIDSLSKGNDIVENSSAGQLVYTITATDDFFNT